MHNTKHTAWKVRFPWNIHLGLYIYKVESFLEFRSHRNTILLENDLKNKRMWKMIVLFFGTGKISFLFWLVGRNIKYIQLKNRKMLEKTLQKCACNFFQTWSNYGDCTEATLSNIIKIFTYKSGSWMHLSLKGINLTHITTNLLKVIHCYLNNYKKSNSAFVLKKSCLNV